jgi:phage terminase large subunit-like protein
MGLSPADAERLFFDWRSWARQKQLPPARNPRRDDGWWFCWLLLTGRGFGKNRTAGEWVREEIESGRRREVGIVGPTKEHSRKIHGRGAIRDPGCLPKLGPSGL